MRESLASAPAKDSVVPLPTYVSRFAGSPTHTIAAPAVSRATPAAARPSTPSRVSPASGNFWPLKAVSRWSPSTNWRDSQPAAAAPGSSVVGGAAWAGDATTVSTASSASNAAEAAARTRRVGVGTDRATRAAFRHRVRAASRGSLGREPGRSQLGDRRRPGDRPADLDGMGEDGSAVGDRARRPGGRPTVAGQRRTRTGLPPRTGCSVVGRAQLPGRRQSCQTPGLRLGCGPAARSRAGPARTRGPRTRPPHRRARPRRSRR